MDFVVGIVIPTHNRCQALLNTLSNLSAARADGFQVRVFVVADDCSDSTVEEVSRRFPSVRLLMGPEAPLWWSASINLGANAALAEGVDYVLVYNDDITMDSDCLQELVNLAQAVPGSIVGPKILEAARPHMVFAAGGRSDWLRAGAGICQIGTAQEDGPHLSSVRLVEWFPGMGTLIPRKVWETLGGLDARNFPQYLSDADLGLRASARHIPLLLCPSAKLYNDTSQTAEQVPRLGALWSKLKSSTFHGNFVARLTFLLRHCPIYLVPLRLVHFYAWLLLRSWQREWKSRSSR